MSLFSPVLGTFLILRRQSLMSDTPSHVSLSGLHLAWYWVHLTYDFNSHYRDDCGSFSRIFAALSTRDFMEIGTAILMSTGLAIALIVMSRGKSSSSMSLDQYLFGSIVTISTEQVISPIYYCGNRTYFDLSLHSTNVYFDL